MLNKPRKQRAGTSKASSTLKKQSQITSKKNLGVHTLSRYLTDVKDFQEKPFLDYSEAEMKSKIEKLYRKTILPSEPLGRKHIEIDPDQKDKLDKERYLKQRERVSKRLKELEKTKPIKTEIQLKEDRLTEVRQEHDELHFQVERNRKKLSDLSDQMARIASAHEQQPDTDVETLKYNLGEIEQSRVLHELVGEQLKHRSLVYKDDILRQQETLQRLREELRLGRTKKEKFNKEFENLSKECDKYWGKIVENCNKNEVGEPKVHQEGFLAEQDLDTEVILFQGRSAWNTIEVEQKKLEMEEHLRVENSNARKDKKARDKITAEFNTRMNRYQIEKRKYDKRMDDVKKLQDVLRIGREDEIIDTYRELMGNREKIKEITSHYKMRVDEVEDEIKRLQEEYMHQKYEVHGVESRYDDPRHVTKVIEIIKAHEKEFGPNKSEGGEIYSEELSKLRKKLVSYVKKEKNEEETPISEDSEVFEKLKNKSDLDTLALLEHQFSDSFKELFKKELEMKRMSALVNSACTTVSRIMYQLDRNVPYSYKERKEL